jgi:serine protease
MFTSLFYNKFSFRRINLICLLVLASSDLRSSPTDYSIIIHIQDKIDFKTVFDKNTASKNAVTPFYNLQHKEVLSSSMNIHLITLTSELSSVEIIELISKNYPIASAQHNRKVYPRCFVPNDLRFPDQWHLRNTGQNGGYTGADIHVCDAWDMPQRITNVFGDTIVVAVIDVFADLNCTQINWFKNYADIPNNAIDDDGNGYVDDHHGWNSIDNSGQVQTISGEIHQTMIAGIIGAKGNDTVGVSGVHWGVKVLPIVGSNVSDESDIVQAYAYCIDMKKLYLQTGGVKGAYIVATNSSFGIDNEWDTDHPIWCAMYDSMGKYSILSTVSAPNASVDVDVVGDMPSTCTSNFIIAVSGTNFQDKKSSSGIGKKYIDIHAPSEGIISTKPGNVFGSGNGTSYAAPQVVGAISLMISQANDSLTKKFDNGDTSAILFFKNTLLKNADTLATLKNFSTTGGRLNISKAVAEIKKSYKRSNSINQVNSKNISYFLNDKKLTIVENADLIDKVDIYNYIGMLVSGFEFDKNSHLIDLSHLSNGIYIIRLSDKENTFAVKILVE